MVDGPIDQIVSESNPKNDNDKEKVWDENEFFQRLRCDFGGNGEMMAPPRVRGFSFNGVPIRT